MLSPDPPDERGSVLVIAVVMMGVFFVAGATILTLSSTEMNIATNNSLASQAFYLAESGAQAAYQTLASVNFQGRTHNADGTPATAFLLPTAAWGGNLVLDDAAANGLNDERDDYRMVWEWSPGDPGNSLTGTNLNESFRFSIRPAVADPDEFVIEVEGRLGDFRRRLMVRGYTEPVFNYAIFSDGPLSEFTRGQDQHVSGKVHANGDMFFRPWNPRTLSIDAPSVTATGQMVRTTDIFGRDLYAGSTVKIKDGSGTYVEMALGAPGSAMDSQNTDWTNNTPTDGIDGAMELWDGIVRDGSLGATSVDPPPVEALHPGGWYDTRADLRLRGGDSQVDSFGNDVSAGIGDAVTEVTFWNPAQGEYVTVQELDVARLQADGNFPPNGLLYSDVPLRIVNGDQLQGDLTIVGAHSVYTKGDYNSVNKRSSAIISAGRIWHLSNAWSDDEYYTKGARNLRQAANGTTTINAAMVDGQPAVSTAHYADLDGDGNRDDTGAGNAIANADHLLETWGGSRTLKKYGSIVHLQFADMADNVYNSGKSANEVSWTRWSAYSPPTRDYGYDPALAGTSGQPPFTLLVGKIFLWQEIGS